MTNENAINILRWLNPPRTDKESFDNFVQAIDIAIEALEKQVPMKLLPPEMGIDGRVITPCGYCGEELPKKAFYEYCPYCGQKIKR